MPASPISTTVCALSARLCCVSSCVVESTLSSQLQHGRDSGSTTLSASWAGEEGEGGRDGVFFLEEGEKGEREGLGWGMVFFFFGV